MKILLRRFLTSVLLSAGILSIANIETILHEDGQGDRFARQRLAEAKDRLRQRLAATGPRAQTQGLLNMLRDSLAQDEFGEVLPFSALASFEPLEKIFAKGVRHFDRQVFRSPDYQGESGYDLVQYQIEHTNGERSSIVAYLERAALTAVRNIGSPDARIPMVMIVSADGEQSKYSLYRDGHLTEHSTMPTDDASGLVAQRIASSIPFLSVAR